MLKHIFISIMNINTPIHQILFFQQSFNDCPSTRFEMLIYVTDFLQKHNIEYFIAYGTLLGAVREQDIITHTPDIDICVHHLEHRTIKIP